MPDALADNDTLTVEYPLLGFWLYVVKMRHTQCIALSIGKIGLSAYSIVMANIVSQLSINLTCLLGVTGAFAPPAAVALPGVAFTVAWGTAALTGDATDGACLDATGFGLLAFDVVGP